MRILAWILLPLGLIFAGCDANHGSQQGTGDNDQNAQEVQQDDDENGDENGENTPQVAHPEAAYPYQLQADLARVYLRHNAIDQAIRLFELAIVTQAEQTGTRDAEVVIGLAEALVKAGRNQEAINAYNEALRIYTALFEQNVQRGGDNQLHNHYVGRVAALYGILGDRQQQATWLARLRADDNIPEQQLELGQHHERLENWADAEAAYGRARELWEENAEKRAVAEVALARLLYRTERGDQAIEMARGVLDTEGINAETRRAAMRLLFDIYEARDELDKLEFR
jgi:tetratricopeptide (TPR) repeat protein